MIKHRKPNPLEEEESIRIMSLNMHDSSGRARDECDILSRGIVRGLKELNKSHKRVHRHVGRYKTKKGVVKRRPVHKHMVMFRKDLGENKKKITNKDFGKLWYKEGEEIDERLTTPFDEPRKMLVHGTSLERAKQILASKKATGGTWVGGFRGGVIDAQTWAENSFKNEEPVVVIAKAKEDLRKKMEDEPWGWIDRDTAWVTFGKRAEERKHHDITMPSAELEEVRVFKIKKHKPDYVNLEEVIL